MLLMRFVLLAFVGTATATLPGPASYSEEAGDIKNFMESVRRQTEGGSATAVAEVIPTSAQESLDSDLMQQADRVEKEMAELNKPKPALATQKQETKHGRAARYFAMHGMGKIGSMLGDQLSKEEEATALKEAAAVKKLNAQVVAAPKLSVSFDAPMEEEDDDQDKEVKKRWAAVDALRHRAPRLALVGTAMTSLRGPPSYAEDVDDVKSMMESVRRQTEGGASGDVVAAVKPMAVQGAGDFFPGEHALDDDLMKQADRVEKEMGELNQPKPSLATQKQVTTHGRAARYFAMHGMSKIGSMLGDQLSKEEEVKALKEAATVKKLNAEVVAEPKRSLNLDTPFEVEDDVEDTEAKKRWAAVDALRHRAPRLAFVGTATRTVRSPASYAADANDIKNVMESVRRQTEGSPAEGFAAATPLSSPDTLDNDLMKQADRVEKEMAEMNKPKAAKMALTTQKQETKHEHAARFFAMHGMNKIGSMLGDHLSKQEESDALKEAAQLKKLNEEIVTAPTHASSADTAMEEDDDDASETKKRWAMVDALRHRAPHV